MAGKGRVGPNVKHYHIRRVVWTRDGERLWTSGPIGFWQKAWARVTRMARQDSRAFFQVAECNDDCRVEEAAE